ncbi:zinc finger protein 831 [Colossoma macropomum]|uniref:zinc finger protein 831 n=1 Tax=Colossoma macropomum TaxID=42526 RepID=UPI001864761C|nr:zinc finger protein 831 [Colossoma macropomum]XP_036415830.1 zinc finger protein 831 [Colossoma macropomum]
MATGKQGFVRAAEPQHSVSMQREKEMRVQAPLTAMYIQAMPGLPTYPQPQPTAMQDAAVIPLPMPMMCANQALPILTLHIASGATVQQQRPETPASSPRPKSAGKHVCPHCGRDCLKPSVLEKHLRCHTGERPYPCTTCGISFKTQSNLYKHKRTQAHARLSSESGKGDFSSQESTDSLRDTCSSPSLELQSEDSGDINKNDSVLPVVTTTTFSSVQATLTEEKTASDTEWALCKAAVVGLVASPAHGQQEILNSGGQRVQLASEAKNEAASIQTISQAGDGNAPLTPNRTPLQRQEAVISKLSRGKSQSHGSTDSGFSESSEQPSTSSPGDTLHDPSMESLPESSMELQEPGNSKKLSDVATDDAKTNVSVQEKQKLEEHILKLISENSVLVDDKHLVNVRPRKTVLSKQGSIDLPMPYTYKDSFHFEMRSSKHQVSGLQTQDRRGRTMYSSVPTQHSTSLEHAPLTRSSSLPFSVGIQNSDRTASSFQGDSIPLSRRCSAGNIYPFKSVDQHAPSHRSLVRQVAVDCLSVAEGSSVERGNHSSLSSDGDCGDTSTESGGKRCRRKKSQKFAYNKWYMYGGGTFRKLYNTEKDSLLKSRKATLSLEQTESQGIQISQQRDSNSSASVSFTSCPAVSLTPAVNVLTAQTSSQVISSYVLLQSPLAKQTGLLQHGLDKQTNVPSSNLNTETGFMKGTEEKSKGPETQLSSPIPSERKKQKTEDDISVMMENADTLMRQQGVLTSGSGQANASLPDVINQSLQSVCGDAFQTSSITALEKDNRLNLHRQGSFCRPSSSNQTQLLYKRHSSPLFAASVSGTSGSPSASSSISSVSQAKTSFLPKYQLKIPCSTDGASDSGVCSRSSLNQPSPRQAPKLSHQSAQQCDSETSLSSALQCQLSSTMMSSAKEQEVTLSTAATTKTKSTAIPSGACIGQNANKAQTQSQPSIYTSTSVTSATPTLVSLIPENKHANVLTQHQGTAYSKSGPSISSVLSQPLQTFTALGQNQSVMVHSMDSSLSHTSTSTKPIQIYTATTGSVIQNNPATSVVVSRQPPGPPLDTHAPACQSATDGIPLGLSHTAFQGAQFEGKMLLVNDSKALAQDTFYVRTADLQIVMQLISDEQLALIEPQIEKQDILKLDGSHSFLSKETETLQTETIPGVSQGIHKQCPGDTGTEVCVAHRNVNQNTLTKIPDITSISVGSTDTNKAKSSKNVYLSPQNTYLTDFCPKGVISSSGSGSKTEHHISAPLDTSANALGQQHKLISAACEDGNLPKDIKPAACPITLGLCVEQRPGESLSELLSSHKLTSEQPSNSSVHDRVLTHLSAPTVEQSCGAKWSKDTASQGTSDTSMTNLNKPETSTERRPVLAQEKVSDTSKIIDSDPQPLLKTPEQHSSPHLISATDGETIQTKAETSRVSQALLPPLASISTTVPSQEELLYTVQPSQTKSCRLACTSSATVRQMSSGSVLAHTVCQYKPLNQRVVCSKDSSKLKHEAPGNKTCQAAAQYSSQQHGSSLGAEVARCNSGEVKALTASTALMTSSHFKSNTPVSENTHEESIERGEATGDMDPVNQDSFSGPRVGGTLQSSPLQRAAGTGSWGWVPQEPESGGGEGEMVGNNCMEQEDHAREVKREGATDLPEGYRTAAKPHPHLSQPVTNACHNTSSPAQLDTSTISDNATPALCGATSLSHDPLLLDQRKCTHLDNSWQVQQSSSVKGTPKLSGQSKAKETERVPLGCQERFTSLATGQSDAKHLHPTCGHLLAHPLLVNAIQKEVQKDTQTSATQQSHSRGSQEQRPMSEHKPYGKTKVKVPNEPNISSDSNRTINTTPIHTSPLCPNRTNSNAMHSNPICASTAHHNPTEPNAPQCHLGGSYLEEEESSSSSDDEGKLVIELE